MRPYERFGPFLLAFPLGKGGMGEVYAARTPWPARPVAAVKRLREDVAATPTYAERFAHEAELAVRLEHDNIVDTIDVGAVDGRLYIASELILGKSVGAIADHLLAQRQGAPTAIVIRVLVDVLAGLAYGHAATDRDGRWLRLVHRDVTPGNVLVGYDGVTRLTDFGLAKSGLSDQNLTQVGAIIGTPSYIAPELIRAERPTPAADIYSLGAVAYRFLTGVPPFEGTKAEIMQRALTERPRSVLEIRPDLPEWFVEIIQRMMSPDPMRRPGDAGELRSELEQTAREHDLAIDQSWVDLWMATYFEKDRQRSLADAQAIASLQPVEPDSLPDNTQIFARSDILSIPRGPSRDPHAVKLAEEPTRIIREDMLARRTRELSDAARLQIAVDDLQLGTPPPRDARASPLLSPRPSRAEVSSGTQPLPLVLESGVLVHAPKDDGISVTLVPRPSASPPAATLPMGLPAPSGMPPVPPMSEVVATDATLPLTRATPRPSAPPPAATTVPPGPLPAASPLGSATESTPRLPAAQRGTHAARPAGNVSLPPRTRRIRALVAMTVILALGAMGLGVSMLRERRQAEATRRALVDRIDQLRDRVDRKIAAHEAIEPRTLQLLTDSTRAALAGDYPRAEALLGDLDQRLATPIPTSTRAH